MNDDEKLNIALRNAATNALKSAIERAGGPEILADSVAHRVLAKVSDDGLFIVEATDEDGNPTSVDELASELKAQMPGAFRPKAPPACNEPPKPKVPTYDLADWTLLLGMASREERTDLMRRLAANEIEVLS